MSATSLRDDVAPGFGSRRAATATLCLGILYLVWGSTYLALRYVVEALPPMLFAGVRFILASCLLLGILRVLRKPFPTAKEWAWALPIGLLMGLCGNGFVCVAEREISSSIAAVVCASMPLFAAAFGFFVGQKPRARELVGLVIGFAGVALMCAGALHGSLQAVALLLAAPPAWAIGSLLARKHFRSGLSTAGAQLLIGGAALILVGTLRGEHWPAHAEPRAYAALAYLVLIGSLVGFSAYAYLLQNTRAAVSMSYAYVNPAVAMGLGALLGGEHVGFGALAGCALIIVGVVLVVGGDKPQAAAKPAMAE